MRHFGAFKCQLSPGLCWTKCNDGPCFKVPKHVRKSRPGISRSIIRPITIRVGAQNRPSLGVCRIRKRRAYSIRNLGACPGLNARRTRCKRSALSGVCLQRLSLLKLQIQESPPRASDGGFFPRPLRRVCGDVSQTRRLTDVHFCFGKRLTWLTDGTGGRPFRTYRKVAEYTRSRNGLKSACDDH